MSSWRKAAERLAHLAPLEPPPEESPQSICRAALKPGWARHIEGLDTTTADHLERLAALPIAARRGAALNEEVEPTAALILALLDAATALLGTEPPEAHSLADAALMLTGRSSAEGEDCRFLFDNLIEFWLEVTQNYLASDQLGRAGRCLSLLQQLAQMASDEPTLAAQMSLNRAQLHWQRAEVEASLTELEATLAFSEAANDRSLLGAALCYRGIALATTGRAGAARASLQQCLKVLPSSHRLHATVAREALARLDELL